MTLKVEFHFDFGSPNAYLCHRVIPGIEARTGVSFDYVPVLLGGIFKLTHNQSPMLQFDGVKNKNEYQQLETERFIRKHGLEAFVRNPHFPVNTIQLMRAAVALRSSTQFSTFIEACFQQMWEQGQKMDAPAVFDAQLTAAGFDAVAIGEQIQDPLVKQALVDATTQSVERGTFGAPSFFVNDALFFGKDRLRDVEEEIMVQKNL